MDVALLTLLTLLYTTYTAYTAYPTYIAYTRRKSNVVQEVLEDPKSVNFSSLVGRKQNGR